MKEQLNIIKEQQNIMIKVIENGTNHTNITHTNSHNKAFNLNFFLNETCKDAMDITDFVDSIKLQLSDLEKVNLHEALQIQLNGVLQFDDNTKLHRFFKYCKIISNRPFIYSILS